ncbi:MAG: hypothetical protein LBB82_04315 [Treponema sp.]|jgi:hypothetical protein|nr:hypothetical protein [Treponema sp.]
MKVVEKTVGYYIETTGEYIKDFSGQDCEAFDNKAPWAARPSNAGERCGYKKRLGI